MGGMKSDDKVIFLDKNSLWFFKKSKYFFEIYRVKESLIWLKKAEERGKRKRKKGIKGKYIMQPAQLKRVKIVQIA